MILVLLIAATECTNLIPNEDTAWSAYLVGTYTTMAWLCASLRPAWVAWSGAALFASQAVDQVVGGNLFSAGLWEYPLAVLFALGVYLITRLRSHDRPRRP